jgi:hypothetical protein
MSKRAAVGVFKLGESWPCECGKRHPLTGAYLAAHWDEALKHECDNCGAEHEVRRGSVTLIKAGKKARADPR